MADVFRKLMLLSALAFAVPTGPADAASDPDFATECKEARGKREGRVVCADLVALDQMLVYNRFGSFNPYGMIFALRRDVVPLALDGTGTTDCRDDIGTGPAQAPADLRAGNVRLRDCKRPRPLTLRANVGDLLYLQVENLLTPETTGNPPPRDFSRDFCKGAQTDDRGRAAVQPHVSRGDRLAVDHGEASCHDTASPPSPEEDAEAKAARAMDPPDWPRTRGLNLVAEGLMPLALPGQAAPSDACLGLDAVAHDESFACLYEVTQEGTHFFASRAAPAGGEGNGGTITHGLFGAVMAERPGTRWYRSQVSQAALQAVWPRSDLAGAPRHAREAGTQIDYEKQYAGIPILNMARALDHSGDLRAATAVEIVHSDLNGIVWCDAASAAAQKTAPLGCAKAPPEYPQSGTAQTEPTGRSPPTTEPAYAAFREFTVFFHDELKTFYTRNFEELARFGQLAGVRDGFAINYGASGMGSLLLANRKGIGPAAACAECLYEEFFLTSWANGDPALLEWYDDDPSNVHHSYLNDPVVFRNFHAGPKETHVFHLHAHQWFAGNDPGRGSYLDSQTVGPAQGFTYNIYHGGRTAPDGGEDLKRGWYVGGSGNRNRTVGDSIFHCHLYPHFAQGMWALWRVHDVLEDGTRTLPDGQATPGLSLDIRAEGGTDPEMLRKRPGSVDPETGAWLTPDDPETAEVEGPGNGTPIPALVPLPGEPLPPLPTYAPSPVKTGLAPAPRRHAGLVTGGPERLWQAQAVVTVPDPVGPATPAVDAAPQEAAAPEAPDAGEWAAVPEPIDAMPGYPFYIAGSPGHRPPQAPKDIARAIDGSGALTDALLTGALGRHVVADAERELPNPLPADLAETEKTLAADPETGDNRRRLEALRGQAVATALALGDMTAHLRNAKIRPLHADGTGLERAAMRFHENGSGLSLFSPDGSPLTSDGRGGYPTAMAPVPDKNVTPAQRPFQVNGAPSAPGAPFADPCGGAPFRDTPKAGGGHNLLMANDPLTGNGAYVIDPALRGFRRYSVSAVQLDLIVNQAGWHDPQARIDVLTTRSDSFKDVPTTATEKNGVISPVVRDDEEPFFFRALSGECIEFRHTNELPKDLDLDDFQVRTPTDTVGQHIHLVKFDVTSSDGSGNGWNYEDGTFAADELATRLCAWVESGSDDAKRVADDLAGKIRASAEVPPDMTFCDWAPVKAHRLWRLKRSTFPFLFQTTVQRWFADPILTRDGGGAMQDRTMRTVFSHDHFGPSSIQQHGFYTALLVEPNPVKGAPGPVASQPNICGVEKPVGCVRGEPLPRQDPASFAVLPGDEAWIGSRKIVSTHDPAHPDYREFALAVADFALLYDPRDHEDAAAVAVPPPGSSTEHPERFGMSRLLCEATLATTGRAGEMERLCGSAMERKTAILSAAPGDLPPAWWAAGAPGDAQHHRDRLFAALLPGQAVDALREHLIAFRTAAASPFGKNVGAPVLARPVAPPARPESISVDHHDPYMVNYRTAPIPLRVATKNADGSPSEACAPLAMTRPGARTDRTADALAGNRSPVESRLVDGTMPQCSYRYQLTGAAGDVGRALGTWDMDGHPTRNPETPILEAYEGERIMLRLVQGAQEVQHNFNVAGVPFTRNVDQRQRQGMRDLAVVMPPARKACFEALRLSHPEQYDAWLNMDKASDAYWQDFAQAIARCDNIEGYTFAQEVGISEHFEMRGRLRADVLSPEFLRPVTTSAGAPPSTAPDARQPDGPDTGHRQISDYLYNFGSLDSLWNGAWGLVRIHQNGDVPDLQHRGTGRALIRERLASVFEANSLEFLRPVEEEPLHPDAEEPLRLDAEADELLPPTLGACPLPRIGQKWSFRLGVIAAVRVGDVWPGSEPAGTRYGADRSDPDGLMLALLSPADGNGLPRLNAPDGDWQALKRKTILDAVRAAYSRPEPFVLRVNAGDCVMLRYVNALSETTAGAGLPDALGDALAPQIVPLNLDPVPTVQRRMAGDGKPNPGNRTGTWVEGRLTATTTPVTGLRPSARLGLTLGLASAELIRDLPLGYGINREAMPAPLCTGRSDASCRVQASKVFTFYAGRMRLALDPGEGSGRTVALLANDVGAAIEKTLGVSITGLSLDAENPDFVLLGRRYALEDLKKNGQPYALTEAEKRTAQNLSVMVQDGATHWIPYAFGPVPVRATGDVVTQTVHGLFGAIDVVPAQWPLPGESVSDEVADNAAYLNELAARAGRPASYTAMSASKARHNPGFGTPLALTADLRPKTGGSGDAARLREFVIFYQDGLNHHDARSKIEWTLRGDGTKEVNGGVNAVAGRRSDGRMPDLRLTPDCLICDDSYDRGEQGVSYRSRPFTSLLRFVDIAGAGRIEASDDLNAVLFPPRFLDGDGWRKTGGSWRPAPHTDPDFTPLTLQACKGEQVVIRVIHPGGRARQRTFVMNGLGYDDLFPGFGFPNAALLGPGKAASVWLYPPQVQAPDGKRADVSGKVLWHDGPGFLMAGGTWGLVSFGNSVDGKPCP